MGERYVAGAAAPRAETIIVAVLFCAAVVYSATAMADQWIAPPEAPANAPAPAPGVQVMPQPPLRPPPASGVPTTAVATTLVPTRIQELRWGSCAPAPLSLVSQIMIARLDPDTATTGHAAYRPLPELRASLIAVELVGGDVGVWARDGSGLLYAVDKIAQQATGWPPAQLTQLDLAPDAPAVAAARRCLA